MNKGSVKGHIPQVNRNYTLTQRCKKENISTSQNQEVFSNLNKYGKEPISKSKP